VTSLAETRRRRHRPSIVSACQRRGRSGGHRGAQDAGKWLTNSSLARGGANLCWKYFFKPAGDYNTVSPADSSDQRIGWSISYREQDAFAFHGWAHRLELDATSQHLLNERLTVLLVWDRRDAKQRPVMLVRRILVL